MTGNKFPAFLALFFLTLPVFAQTPAPVALPPGIDLRYQSLSGRLLRPHLEGVHFLYGGELSLEADQADGDISRRQYALRGHAQAQEADTTLRASEITFNGLAHRASATDVLLTQGVITLHSDSLTGTPTTAAFTDVDVATVPPGERPDLRLHAKTITVDAVHRQATLRNISLYLFGARLVTIPSFKFTLPSTQKTVHRERIAPFLSYSSRYGVFLTVGSTVHVANLPIHYRLLLPTRMSVEGNIFSQQTLIATRKPLGPVSPSLPEAAGLLMRLRLLTTAPRLPLPDGDPLLFHDFLPEANPVSLFSLPTRGSLRLGEEVSVHSAARGNNRDDLYVTRLPEVMLTGQMPLMPGPNAPLPTDPSAFRHQLRRIVLIADGMETIGNYREQLPDAPYSIRARRLQTEIGLSARPLLLGWNTVLLPRVSITTNSYSGSHTAYRYDQLSLAVNHYFSDLDAVGVQYLASTTGGNSPFNFDVLDTSRELDLRLQMGNRHLVTAGRVRFDLTNGGVIDYQLAVSPGLRGFSPVFSYNFRTRSMGLGIEIKGITF